MRNSTATQKPTGPATSVCAFGMKLSELKLEIEQSARSVLTEKAYPITSGWVPLTDILAILDRFEREWRREFEAASTVARRGSRDELKQTVESIVAKMLT